MVSMVDRVQDFLPCFPLTGRIRHFAQFNRADFMITGADYQGGFISDARCLRIITLMYANHAYLADNPHHVRPELAGSVVRRNMSTWFRTFYWWARFVFYVKVTFWENKQEDVSDMLRAIVDVLRYNGLRLRADESEKSHFLTMWNIIFNNVTPYDTHREMDKDLPFEAPLSLWCAVE